MSQCRTTMKRSLAAMVLAAALLSACSTMEYYGQAIGGQLEIANRAEPIDALLAQPQTPARLRAQLERALEIRRFASAQLGLPDNNSYRRYADLGRPYAVWNVFAAPALSIAPKQWCFLMVGCVAYRGYFERAQAERFAAELTAEGFDVYIAGIPAFSTLGWFADPVLNTFVNQSELNVAALVFHELAHQQLYVKDDSAFNESFATVVELEGVRRWAVQRDETNAFDRFLASRQRREQFATLVLSYRERLGAIYQSEWTQARKLAAKAATIAEMKRAYGKLKADWGGWDGYDAWFEKPINNAQLASVGLYHEHVAALQRLLANNAGDLPAFYHAAAVLADTPRKERNRQLATLSAGSARR